MKTFLLVLFFPFLACGQKYDWTHPPLVPDAKMTPGAIRDVTSATLATTKTGTVRNVPESLKHRVFLSYFGVVPPRPSDFEIDHLVSLEIGGANDQKNLWPQSYKTVPLNAHVKDRLEDRCAALVRHTLVVQGPTAADALLHQIQQEIATDWTKAYVKYLGPLPK